MGWEKNIQGHMRAFDTEMLGWRKEKLQEFFLENVEMEYGHPKGFYFGNREKSQELFASLCIYEMVSKYKDQPEAAQELIEKLKYPDEDMQKNMREVGQRVQENCIGKGASYATSVYEEGRAVMDKISSPIPERENQGYYDELCRLAKQMQKTEQMFSKGSQSFQAMREILKPFTEGKPMPEGIDMREKMAEVMKACEGYLQEHRDMNLNKLSSTQMERLKTIRRIQQLDSFVQRRIDPESYLARKEKLAEKIVDSMAIRNQKLGKDKKGAFRDMMLNKNSFFEDSVAAVENSRAYQQMTKVDDFRRDEMDQMLHTNGARFIDQYIKESAKLDMEAKLVEEDKVMRTFEDQLDEVNNDELEDEMELI